MMPSHPDRVRRNYIDKGKWIAMDWNTKETILEAPTLNEIRSKIKIFNETYGRQLTLWHLTGFQNANNE